MTSLASPGSNLWQEELSPILTLWPELRGTGEAFPSQSAHFLLMSSQAWVRPLVDSMLQMGIVGIRVFQACDFLKPVHSVKPKVRAMQSSNLIPV